MTDHVRMCLAWHDMSADRRIAVGWLQQGSLLRVLFSAGSGS